MWIFLATSSIHNRSTTSKPLNNTSTYTHFAPPRHTTLDVSMRPSSVSIAQTSVSKAELPYRNLAPLGVLSKYRIDFFFFLYSSVDFL